ncbi:recombinase RecT (plasmid) [Borrelia coriaceae]|uniref:recombinase RecT n=1 Tax=Borrelia coriaceae TaxID=144 RepID=UPI001FF3EC65|nr:recombinase RecT [Borrelia coriaceae]UPA16781.1 recombinase RecT [Borrelia coriaceae]
MKNIKNKMGKANKSLKREEVKDTVTSSQNIVTNENQAKIEYSITRGEISTTINTIADKMNSNNIYEVWKAYKSMYGLKGMDFASEREILTLLQINNLNPFKKEAYIIPFNGRYTVVVAYQTLLIRAYEAGYNRYTLEFKEEPVKTRKFDFKGNIVEREDLQCTAYFKSDDGSRYSFSILLSEYYKNTPIWRDKQIFMLRKCAVSCLCRTLPGAGLESMPYIREELGDVDMICEEQNIQKIENTKTTDSKSTMKMQSISHDSMLFSNETVKRVPSKYYYYKNLLQASKRMHSQLDNTPFDSLEMIDKFLHQLQEDDDSNILNYFENKPELKTVEYWTRLLNCYLKKTESDPGVVEGFSKFLVCREPKYGQSPLRLFGSIASDENFSYLCK